MKARCGQSIMTIKSIVSELENIAAEVLPEVSEDDTARKRLLAAGRLPALKLEKPWDIVRRLFYLVRFYVSTFEYEGTALNTHSASSIERRTRWARLEPLQHALRERVFLSNCGRDYDMNKISPGTYVSASEISRFAQYGSRN